METAKCDHWDLIQCISKRSDISVRYSVSAVRFNSRTSYSIIPALCMMFYPKRQEKLRPVHSFILTSLFMSLLIRIHCSFLFVERILTEIKKNRT